MNNDEWFALADKIDMIPNDETARMMRELYMSIEVDRVRGRHDPSDDQHSIKNVIDFVLSKKTTQTKETTNEHRKTK